MKSWTIAGIIAIVAVVALGTVTTLAAEPTLPPGCTWYEDDEFKFKIGYPETWERMPEEQITCTEPTLHVTIFQEPDTPATITVEVCSSEFDIEGFKAKGAKDVVINGRDGYEVTIEQDFPPIKNRVFAFVVDDRVYRVHCMCKTDIFDEHEATFDNVINSFVIAYPAPVTEAAEEPGFEAVFTIAGLLAVAYLLRRSG